MIARRVSLEKRTIRGSQWAPEMLSQGGEAKGRGKQLRSEVPLGSCPRTSLSLGIHGVFYFLAIKRELNFFSSIILTSRTCSFGDTGQRRQVVAGEEPEHRTGTGAPADMAASGTSAAVDRIPLL